MANRRVFQSDEDRVCCRKASAHDLRQSAKSGGSLHAHRLGKPDVRAARAAPILEIRGLPHSAFGRTKRTLADQKDFGLGEDAITWILNQLLEVFMQSAHIEEIYADDPTLRRKLREILQKHMTVDEELDREVRQRIKNFEEGNQTWEIEYNRVLEQMKTKFGLKE